MDTVADFFHRRRCDNWHSFLRALNIYRKTKTVKIVKTPVRTKTTKSSHTKQNYFHLNIKQSIWGNYFTLKQTNCLTLALIGGNRTNYTEAIQSSSVFLVVTVLGSEHFLNKKGITLNWHQNGLIPKVLFTKR